MARSLLREGQLRDADVLTEAEHASWVHQNLVTSGTLNFQDGTISGTGSIYANTYFGDGSGITGITADSPTSIAQGNSYVEVTDSGTGQIDIVADGTNVLSVSEQDMRLGKESDAGRLEVTDTYLWGYIGSTLALNIQETSQSLGSSAGTQLSVSQGARTVQVRISGNVYAQFGDSGNVTFIGDPTDTNLVINQSANSFVFESANTTEATINTNGLSLKSGTSVNEFSIDGTLAGNSDDAVPTEKAVKTYTDTNFFKDYQSNHVLNNLYLTDDIYIYKNTPSGISIRVGESGSYKYMSFDPDGILKVSSSTVWHAGNDGSGSGLDADTLDGKQTTSPGDRWNVVPLIDGSGVMEVGKYIDFHETDADAGDNDLRMYSESSVLNIRTPNVTIFQAADSAKLVITGAGANNNAELRLQTDSDTWDIFNDESESNKLKFTNDSGTQATLSSAGNLWTNNNIIADNYIQSNTIQIITSGTIAGNDIVQYDADNNEGQIWTNAIARSFKTTWNPSSYFTTGEYIKVLEITPAWGARNYTVIGSVYATTSNATQLLEFRWTVRSNTLPEVVTTLSYNRLDSFVSTGTSIKLVEGNDATNGSAALYIKSVSGSAHNLGAEFTVFSRDDYLEDVVVSEQNENQDLTEIPASYDETDGRIDLYIHQDGQLTYNGNEVLTTASGISTNAISQGDSNVTVTDAGTGQIDMVTDGDNVFNVTSTGMRVGTSGESYLQIYNTGSASDFAIYLDDGTEHFYITADSYTRWGVSGSENIYMSSGNGIQFNTGGVTAGNLKSDVQYIGVSGDTTLTLTQSTDTITLAAGGTTVGTLTDASQTIGITADTSIILTQASNTASINCGGGGVATLTDASQIFGVIGDTNVTMAQATGIIDVYSNNTAVVTLTDAAQTLGVSTDTNITITQASDNIVFEAANTTEATIDTNGLTLKSGASVNEFSTDGTLAGDSDDAVPTEKAVKTYVDTQGFGSNALINGNFDIWQRGTSFTTGYTADRWNIGLTGETATVSRQTFTPGQADVPGNPKYYLRAAITTGGAAATALAILTQYIEGVEKHSGETVTISFYAKASSGTPDIVTEFVQYFGAGGSDNVYTYCDAHTLSTSWQKFTVTVDVPSISGKTIGSADDALVFVFWFSAGSNYAARTGSLGQQSITCDIAQVQVEKGSVATEFEQRTFAEELALCQRYFQKSFDLATTPADDVFSVQYPGMVYATNNCQAWVPFVVRMREAPTITLYGDSGNSSRWDYYSGGWQNATGQTTTGIREIGFNLNVVGTMTANNASLVRGDWIASAEF